jgi:hypothetical protein
VTSSGSQSFFGANTTKDLPSRPQLPRASRHGSLGTGSGSTRRQAERG